MSRLPISGQDDGQWGDILNDFLSQELFHDISNPNNPDNGKLKIRTNGTLDAKYIKPTGGIPTVDIADGSITASKLSSPVNSILADAQTAVQSVNGKAGTSITLAADDVGAASSSALAAHESDPLAHSGTLAPLSTDPTNTGKAIDAHTGQPFAVIVGGSGLLANRPAATSVSPNTRYFATDDNGGTEYVSTGSAWLVVGPRGVALATSIMTTDDTLRTVGFQPLFGPTSNTGTPTNTTFKVSWVSRGLPVMVTGRAVLLKDSTAAAYMWSYIDPLGDTTTNIQQFAHFTPAPANNYITVQPMARFNDPAGQQRTVGLGCNSPTGGYTAKGTIGAFFLRVVEE